MHSVLGNSFKAAESKQSRRTRSFHKTSGLMHPVMVGYADYLDASFFTGRNNCGVVIGFRLKGCLLAVPMKIRKRVNLQSATVETRARLEALKAAVKRF